MVTTKGKPIDLRKISITDPFWKKEMELVRKEVIPYQWEAINDRVEGAEPSFAMRNFKVAGKITARRKAEGANYKEIVWPLDTFQTLPKDMDHMEDRFYGFLFQDSDFSKWIEAVGYSLTQNPDPELEKIADEAIDIVCAAQQPSGYLDTYYIINDMSKIFTNLKDNHELYCFGHLTEGAVAYYQATGKDKLLNAARKYADYVDSRFGREEGKLKGYPGHEIAEMALVRLYEVTGQRKYLDLSTYFVNERGTKPFYYDNEHPEEIYKGDNRYRYYQAHLPVRDQSEAWGHAVRAVYLYSGMADVARLTGDDALFAACNRLWDNIVNKKFYITGGIGGTHIGEAFSFDYDLPNDTAYSETCAAIGLVFFARRMLQMEVDSKYSNVMERALYNTVLAGMALDGKSFFYVNPLEVNPKACHEDERKFHVKPVRQKWFGCACCPPNIARMLSSVGAYAYSENDSTLFMHLYVGGSVEKEYVLKDGGIKTVTWDIESDIPWGKKISIKCAGADCGGAQAQSSRLTGNGAETDDGLQTLAIRIPDWAEAYVLNCGQYRSQVEKGYLYITGDFKEGDIIELNFESKVRIIKSNRMLSENQGKVAVTYGPLVYCMEEADNGKDLHSLYLVPDASNAKIEPLDIAGNQVLAITLKGKKEIDSNPELYSEYQESEFEAHDIKLIPYYTWANRGEGEMRVWINR